VVSTATEIGQVLRRAAGAPAVRPGTAPDRVAGVRPLWVVRPPGIDEVAAALAAATSHGWAVVPRGSGGGLDWGPAPHRCDVLLDLTGLDGVLEHVAGDLVVTARAGMTVAALQQAVGTPAARQRLMVDAHGRPSATLGGLVATAAAGPRRHGYGTPRDLLLGARFVLADGTVARTGGRVVKNVAGYDLCKLLVGSRGTLAVVVEVTLKLHPDPAHHALVVVDGVSAAALPGLVTAIRRAPAVVTAAQALWPERQLVLRVEGSREATIAEAGALARELGGRVLTEALGARCWSRLLRRPWERPGAVVGVAVPPGRAGELAERLGELEGSASLSAGLGVGTVRVADDPAALDRLRGAVEQIGGWCRAYRVSPGGFERVATRPEPGVLRLMANLRGQLDPSGTLSPGRLGWGLP